MVVRVSPGPPAIMTKAPPKRPVRAIDIAGPWTLEAEGHDPVRLADLRSWTQDPGMLHFSGTAVFTPLTIELIRPVGARGTDIIDEVSRNSGCRCQRKSCGVGLETALSHDGLSIDRCIRKQLRSG